MTTYKVKAGDSWAAIAGKLYGNQRAFGELQRANPGKSNLRPGMTINAPANMPAQPYVSKQDMRGQGGLPQYIQQGQAAAAAKYARTGQQGPSDTGGIPSYGQLFQAAQSSMSGGSAQPTNYSAQFTGSPVAAPKVDTASSDWFYQPGGPASQYGEKPKAGDTAQPDYTQPGNGKRLLGKTSGGQEIWGYGGFGQPFSGQPQEQAPAPTAEATQQLVAKLPAEKQGTEFGLPPGDPNTTMRGKLASFMGNPLGSGTPGIGEIQSGLQQFDLDLSGNELVTGLGLALPAAAIGAQFAGVGALAAIPAFGLGWYAAHQQQETAKAKLARGEALTDADLDPVSRAMMALNWPFEGFEKLVGLAPQIAAAATGVGGVKLTPGSQSANGVGSIDLVRGDFGKVEDIVGTAEDWQRALSQGKIPDKLTAALEAGRSTYESGALAALPGLELPVPAPLDPRFFTGAPGFDTNNNWQWTWGQWGKWAAGEKAPTPTTDISLGRWGNLRAEDQMTDTPILDPSSMFIDYDLPRMKGGPFALVEARKQILAAIQNGEDPNVASKKVYEELATLYGAPGQSRDLVAGFTKLDPIDTLADTIPHVTAWGTGAIAKSAKLAAETAGAQADVLRAAGKFAEADAMALKAAARMNAADEAMSLARAARRVTGAGQGGPTSLGQAYATELMTRRLTRVMREGLEAGRDAAGIEKALKLNAVQKALINANYGKEVFTVLAGQTVKAPTVTLNPLTWGSLMRLTASSNAQEWSTQAANHITTWLSDLPVDEAYPERATDLFLRVLDNPEGAPPQAGSAMSLEGRVVRRMLEPSRVEIENLRDTQRLFKPDIDWLNKASESLGVKPADLMHAATGDIQELSLADKRVLKFATAKDAGQTLVAEIGKVWPEGVKAAGDKPAMDAAGLQSLSKVMLENQIPYTPNHFRAKLMATVYGNAGKWAARTFEGTPPDFMQRLNSAVKAVESVALLGGNVFYPFRNIINNYTTMAMRGAWGLTGINAIRETYRRMGIAPARGEENLTQIEAMAGALGGRTDTATTWLEADQLSPQAIEKAALQHGRNEYARAANPVQEGPLEFIRQKASALSSSIPTMQFSRNMEQLQGSQAYFAGFRQMWNGVWKRGVGFEKMPTELETSLARINPQLPNYVYAAVESGYSLQEIMQYMGKDAPPLFTRAYIDNVPADSVMRQAFLDSVASGLDAALQGADTPEKVHVAIESVRHRHEAAITEQTALEFDGKVDEVHAKVQLGDAAGALTALDDINAKWLETYTEHTERLRHWWDMANSLGPGPARDYILKKMQDESNARWLRFEDSEAAVYKGLTGALGDKDWPHKDAYLAAVDKMQQARRSFFDDKRKVLDEFFAQKSHDVDAWEKVQAQLDKMYADRMRQTYDVQRAVDNYLINRIAESNPWYAEATRAWRSPYYDFLNKDTLQVLDQFKLVRQEGMDKTAEWTRFNRERLKRHQDFRSDQASKSPLAQAAKRSQPTASPANPTPADAPTPMLPAEPTTKAEAQLAGAVRAEQVPETPSPATPEQLSLTARPKAKETTLPESGAGVADARQSVQQAIASEMSAQGMRAMADEVTPRAQTDVYAIPMSRKRVMLELVNKFGVSSEEAEQALAFNDRIAMWWQRRMNVALENLDIYEFTGRRRDLIDKWRRQGQVRQDDWYDWTYGAFQEKGGVLLEQGLSKGGVDFLRDGRALITAFRDSADLSTWVHETGHVFRVQLEDMARLKDMARLPGNSQLLDDWRYVERWAGLEEGEFRALGEQFRARTITPEALVRYRDAEEMFARAFEQYLTTFYAGGLEAPIVRVFEQLRTWMREIYQRIMDEWNRPGQEQSDRMLNGEDINPQLREVLDRVLLEDVRPSPGKAPTVNPELPGMPPAQPGAQFIRARNWDAEMTRLMAEEPYYKHPKQVENAAWHLGYDAVTDENLPTVMADMRARANYLPRDTSQMELITQASVPTGAAARAKYGVSYTDGDHAPIVKAMNIDPQILTPQERADTLTLLRKMALMNEPLGVGNLDARDAVLRAAQAGQPMTWVSFDIGGLGAVNNELGHAAGDNYMHLSVHSLLTNFGEDAILFRRGGGDELQIGAFGDRAAVEAAAAEALHQLENGVWEVGDGRKYQGGLFSYGLGDTPDDADIAAEIFKKGQESRGERLKGKLPQNVHEVDASTPTSPNALDPNGVFSKIQKYLNADNALGRAPEQMSEEGLTQAVAGARAFAARDQLTGLLSQAAFETDPRLQGRTILALNPEGGKYFNETYGHAWFDKALKVYAGIVAEEVGAENAAHFGSDEFYVAIDGQMPDDLEQRIAKAFNDVTIELSNEKEGVDEYVIHASQFSARGTTTDAARSSIGDFVAAGREHNEIAGRGEKPRGLSARKRSAGDHVHQDNGAPGTEGRLDLRGERAASSPLTQPASQLHPGSLAPGADLAPGGEAVLRPPDDETILRQEQMVVSPRSELPTQVSAAIEQAAQMMLGAVKQGEAGQRIKIGYGADVEWLAQPSTYPAFYGELRRSRNSIERALQRIQADAGKNVDGKGQTIIRDVKQAILNIMVNGDPDSGMPPRVDVLRWLNRGEDEIAAARQAWVDVNRQRFALNATDLPEEVALWDRLAEFRDEDGRINRTLVQDAASQFQERGELTAEQAARMIDMAEMTAADADSVLRRFGAMQASPTYRPEDAALAWEMAKAGDDAAPLYQIVPGAPFKAYAPGERVQTWEVSEGEYIRNKFAVDQARAKKRMDYFAEALPKTKSASDRAFTKAQIAREEALLAQTEPGIVEANKWRQEYIETVKKAISKGEAVPEAVVGQRPEFVKAVDARARYEKGYKTSFANKSAAINDTMREERGFKVKRQDGKPIEPELIQEITDGMDEIEQAVGSVRDLMMANDITIAHTHGKHPFLGDSAGQYHPEDRTITIGVEGFFSGKPIPALAHEWGHWLDFEAGKALGVERKIKRGERYVPITSLSETTRLEGLIGRATRTMTDSYQAKKLRNMASKDVPAVYQEAWETIHVELSAYYTASYEVWARLVEQYVATKVGNGKAAFRAPAYEKLPAWWSKAEFEKLMPDVEREITRRLDILRGGAYREANSVKFSIEQPGANGKAYYASIGYRPQAPQIKLQETARGSDVWVLGKDSYDKQSLTWVFERISDEELPLQAARDKAAEYLRANYPQKVEEVTKPQASQVGTAEPAPVEQPTTLQPGTESTPSGPVTPNVPASAAVLSASPTHVYHTGKRPDIGRVTGWQGSTPLVEWSTAPGKSYPSAAGEFEPITPEAIQNVLGQQMGVERRARLDAMVKDYEATKPAAPEKSQALKKSQAAAPELSAETNADVAGPTSPKRVMIGSKPTQTNMFTETSADMPLMSGTAPKGNIPEFNPSAKPEAAPTLFDTEALRKQPTMEEMAKKYGGQGKRIKRASDEGSTLFQTVDTSVRGDVGGAEPFELPDGTHGMLLGRQGDNTIVRVVETGETLVVSPAEKTRMLDPMLVDEAAGVPVPKAAAMEEAWNKNLQPILDHMERQMVDDLGRRQVQYKGDTLPPDVSRKVGDWIRGDVAGKMSESKLLAMKWGEFKRDSAMLNYSRRHVYDDVLGMVFPYEFWATNSMAAWAVHSLDHPSVLSNYYRVDQFLKRNSKKPGFPARLAGKIKIPMPFLPDWMGDGAWIDPLMATLPLRGFAQPIRQLQRDQANLSRAIGYELDRMLRDEEITAAQYNEVIQAQTGDIWDKAVAVAEQENKDSSPYDIVSSFLSPHLPISWMANAMQGTPEKIGTLPLTRQVRGLTAAFGIGGPTGINLEETPRKALGLPTFDQWEDYRVDRELASMAAEGIITADQAKAAMIDRSGPAYMQAAQRSAQLGGFGEGPSALVGFALEAVTPAQFYTQGEERQRTLAEIRKAEIAKQGERIEQFAEEHPDIEQELSDLSAQERRKVLKDLYKAQWAAENNGDTEPLDKLLQDYPEIEARLALNDDPADRIKNFLVDQVWTAYMALPGLYRKEFGLAAGPTFEQAFLDKETRSYDSIPPETLAQWARTLGRYAPRTIEGSAMPVAWAPPEVARDVDAFYNARGAAWGSAKAGDPKGDLWQRIQLMQTAYFQIPADEIAYTTRSGYGVKSRSTFMDNNPLLGQYWDWRRAWLTAYPHIEPYLSEGNKTTTPETGATAAAAPATSAAMPPKLIGDARVARVAMDYLMSSGAYALPPTVQSELTRYWKEQGSQGTFDSWLAETLAYGGNLSPAAGPQYQSPHAVK